jgi:hypothetical protein
MLDRFSEGDKVKVSFDLRGREWNGKYLTNLNAWRVDNAGAASEEVSGGGSRQSAPENFPADPFPNYTDTPPPPHGGMDDLPF